MASFKDWKTDAKRAKQRENVNEVKKFPAKQNEEKKKENANEMIKERYNLFERESFLLIRQLFFFIDLICILQHNPYSLVSGFNGFKSSIGANL